jgi:4-hydroxy-4-methyl-2-oxoglutarate aldolase
MKSTIVYKRINRVESDIVERAKQCSVADIVEVMHTLTGQAMLLSPDIRPVNLGIRVAGPAITATNFPGDNLMVLPALEVTQPGDIVVLSSLGSVFGPLFGDLAGTTAQSRQVAGVIVDGSIRDLEFLLEHRFPIWTRHVCASHPEKAMAGGVNIPIVCGGISITPGDLIVADSDGVIAIPRDLARSVVDLTIERQKEIEELKGRVQRGESIYVIKNFAELIRERGVVEVDDFCP